MVCALAADFSAIDDCRVTLLRDIRLDHLVVPGCKVVEIHSDAHRREELARAAAKADHTLVIAPEFDDLLLEANRHVQSAGGRLLAASEAFVSLAGDKHRTALQLAAAGVPVPEAVWIDSDQERLPTDFSYPSVLKPVSGAGSQHTLLVASPQDEPPPYPWPRRLERYCVGTAASVAFLCGPKECVALPPCRQHLTDDGRFSYTGGSLLQQADLAERATTLARQALDVLAPEAGYVGVDLILGHSADGSEDFVIEINPRVTTSYVGLRAASQTNLAAAMLAVAAGEPVDLKFHEAPLAFSAEGAVHWEVG